MTELINGCRMLEFEDSLSLNCKVAKSVAFKSANG